MARYRDQTDEAKLELIRVVVRSLECFKGLLDSSEQMEQGDDEKWKETFL
jgi:hypothetical protein